MVGALPQTSEELEGTTVWLAIRALGPTLPTVATRIAHVDREEREALQRALVAGPYREVLAAEREGRDPPTQSPPPDAADLDLLIATVFGLRATVTRPNAPMAVGDAARLLDRAVECLRRRQPAEAS